MKNIHILPTDKPSRGLVFLNNTFRIEKGFRNYPNDLYPKAKGYDVYITSDEEIKKGDSFIHSSHGTTSLLKCKFVDSKEIIDNEDKVCWKEYSHKLILTTDQDLIKDGVQAIDDDFLEWFIKNPSCKEVQIVEDTFTVGEMSKLPLGTKNLKYKIIIPKEEPKPLEDEFDFQSRIINKVWDEDEPKQETLEEAANDWVRQPIIGTKRNSFIAGAKWQQERSYSEEEVLEIVSNCDGSISQAKKLFKQFKKK